MAQKPKPTSDFILKCLKDILPFRARNDLLSKLVALWKKSTIIDAAVISSWDRNSNALISAFALENEEIVIDRYSFDSKNDLDKNRVLKYLRSLPRLADLKVAKNRLLPRFQTAALFLFCRKPLAWGENEDQLLELSASLLKQAVANLEEGVQDFEEKLREAKLQAMAELAAGAGHEVNNPLGTISGRVQLLLNQETNPEKRRALLTIGSQAHRVRDMIGDLMLFGRPPAPEFETCDLSELVRKVANKVEVRREEKNFQLALSLEDSVELEADPVQLEIVVHELFRNCFEAIEENGFIEVETSFEKRENIVFAVLKVSDHGRGLNEFELEHLFDPFFSGRQAGRGLGFGLSKCWRIVSNHQGKIEVHSIPQIQTTFTIHWPVHQRSDFSCDT